MYIGLLKLNLFLGSDVRKLVVEGAIKLRLTMNTLQHENKSEEKVATSEEDRRDSKNYHVKSIISPGIKKGLSSIFNFFFGRSSLLSFKPLLILSASAWYFSASAWHLSSSA